MSETTRQDGIGHPDALDRLWTPHRMAYIRGESKPADDSEGECPFCRIPALDIVAPGAGSSRRAAEQDAAERAWTMLPGKR